MAGGGSQQSSSQTTSQNLQNPAFQALAPYSAGQLQNQSDTLGIYSNFLNPLGTGNYTGATATAAGNNPLVAPVTGAQNATLGQIGNTVGNVPNTLAASFGLLGQEASPNFAASLATSPQTQAAEQAAIRPIQQQFASQTVPGLQGSFTQAGQRIGTSNGMGSSAFDNAFAAAQGNEAATEAAATGAIANNAYQTGLNITANAPAQTGALTSSELNDMISGLNAQALPQLTQQYGISAGTQLYQSQLSTLMQALGLQVQGEQPVIGYQGQSSMSGSTNPNIIGSLGGLGGLGSLFSLGL